MLEQFRAKWRRFWWERRRCRVERLLRTLGAADVLPARVRDQRFCESLWPDELIVRNEQTARRRWRKDSLAALRVELDRLRLALGESPPILFPVPGVGDGDKNA